MARVVQRAIDDPNPVKRRRELSEMGTNRADQELNIAKTAKTYLDSFFTTLNDAPSMKGTYYSINIGDTTFSETLNNQKDIIGATRFNKVEDFVLWGAKNQDEIEKKSDEDREVAIDLTEQECIILQGTIRPLKGDHFIFDSQGANAIPYIVSDITPVKLVDKPVYSIKLSLSSTFDTSSLEKCVVGTYKFIFGNIGTQRKTLLLKDTYLRLTQLNKLLVEINSMYVDAFYDLKYDMLRFVSNSSPTIILGCKALREFQHDQEILTWGSNMNTLFVNYPFETTKDTADYRRSYLSSIMKRKLKAFGTTPDMSITNPNEDKSFLSRDIEVRNDINEDNLYMMEDGDMASMEEYEPKYDCIFNLYTGVRTDFSILTLLRKSGLILYEMNSLSPSGRSKSTSDTYIKYEPDSPVVRKFIDMWQDQDLDGIVNSTLLDEYIVSNNNIDDYMMMPIVMWIITMTMALIENDDMIIKF